MRKSPLLSLLDLRTFPETAQISTLPRGGTRASGCCQEHPVFAEFAGTAVHSARLKTARYDPPDNMNSHYALDGS